MADTISATEASSPPTYEELAQIELDFEDVDTEIIARQEHLTTPIYTHRSLLARRIPNFWPLVFEQAPPEIDQYIQPSDSAVFAACLVDMTVTRFETAASLPDSSSPDDPPSRPFGEPRSLAFKFTFAPNEWFEDRVLEKRFYYRRARNGWTGRVSDPVKINWKKGKDLTSGLLDAAVKLFEAENEAEDSSSSKDKGSGGGAVAPTAKGKQKERSGSRRLKEYETLRQKVEASTEGSQSFFTWFGFRGPHLGAEESRVAVGLHERKRKRQRIAAAKAVTTTATGPESEGDAKQTTEEKEVEEEDDEDEKVNDEIQTRFADDAAVEIFPDGEDLAISLAEDLWPSATKYFVAAQEEDEEEGMSDEDFEEDDDMENGGGGGSGSGSGSGSEGDEVPDLRKLVGGNYRKGDGDGDEEVGRMGMGPPSRKKRRT